VRTAQLCGRQSIRHSSAVAVPSGVPSSNVARRYHAPSKRASRSPCAVRPWSLAELDHLDVARASASGANRVRHVGQEEREPHALALALVPDEVHAVVPVAAPDQRQAVLAETEARGGSRATQCS
jgi:hypothetical protein